MRGLAGLLAGNRLGGALKGLTKPTFKDAAFNHGEADQKIGFALQKF